MTDANDMNGAEFLRPYPNRYAAGTVLAHSLEAYADRDDVIVLALPRGGVPVAAPIAEAIGAQLDVLIVRKLGLPEQPELAMGAIAGIGTSIEIIRNSQVLARRRVSEDEFAAVCREETAELRRRQAVYRGDRAAPTISGRTAIVVDDGLATGSTMRAAIAALRRVEPTQIVIAVPIGARRTCAELAVDVNAVVCPWTPEPFHAVGQGYRDFRQTTDEEVQQLLAAN